MGNVTVSGRLHIQQLYVYPIKSLRGIRLPSMSTTASGFAFDRTFMLWDITKSETMHVGFRPSMCLFTTRFDSTIAPTTVEVAFGLDSSQEELEKYLYQDTLSIPLFPRTEQLQQIHITMHKSPTMAYDMGPKYNDWFSARFGYKVKLLYIGNYRREVLGNLPPREPPGDLSVPVLLITAASVATTVLGYTSTLWQIALASSLTALTAMVLLLGRPKTLVLKSLIGRGSKARITFADLAPFLVVSTRSLKNIQARLPEGATLDITKFRPNIVIDGADEAFEEDFWAELQIGKTNKMALTQNCARCNSLNVDYKTGKIACDETGKVLKLLCKDRRVDPGTKWSPVVGRYGFIVDGSTETEGKIILREGDDVRVSARNKERTVMNYPK